MKRRKLTTPPWVTVAIDFLGPLPSGDYLFVMVDFYSRYKEVKIMGEISEKNTISVIQEIWSRLGYKACITSDKGRQFTSTEF